MAQLEMEKRSLVPISDANIWGTFEVSIEPPGFLDLKLETIPLPTISSCHSHTHGFAVVESGDLQSKLQIR